MPIVNPFTLGLGALQTGLSLYGLSKIGKQNDYTISPEIGNAYNRAESMAREGFTGEEEAGFKQNLARSNRLRLQRGLDAGGSGLAGAVNAGINSTNIGALNEFASSDAALKRKNIQYADTLAQAIQHQRNLQTQNLNREREMKQQAYGGALKSGLENIVNPLNATSAFNYLREQSGLNKGLGSFQGNALPSDNLGRPISTPSVQDVFGLGKPLFE